jgi:hypothetical protein
MKHGAVLDIAIGADHDPFVIATKNGIKPDAYIGLEPDTTNNCGIVGNELAIAFQHRNTIPETVDQPAFA